MQETTDLLLFTNKILNENFIFCAVWGKRQGGERKLFAWNFFWLNTLFSRLADSLYVIPVKLSLITRVCCPSQVTYFHHEGTIVVKIENTIFTFYFHIRFSIFIVAIFQSVSNPASIYLFKIKKETLEKHVKFVQC